MLTCSEAEIINFIIGTYPEADTLKDVDDTRTGTSTDNGTCPDTKPETQKAAESGNTGRENIQDIGGNVEDISTNTIVKESYKSPSQSSQPSQPTQESQPGSSGSGSGSESPATAKSIPTSFTNNDVFSVEQRSIFWRIFNELEEAERKTERFIEPAVPEEKFQDALMSGGIPRDDVSKIISNMRLEQVYIEGEGYAYRRNGMVGIT